jgi:ribosome-associated protein
VKRIDARPPPVPEAAGRPGEVTQEEEKDRAAWLARLCARVLDEHKLEDIEIIRVEDALQITDYFVVASGKNPRHLKAATDELLKELRNAGAQRRGLEGYREGKWVLVDFTDVVVHLFLKDNRSFYALEELWGDCPRVSWEPGSYRPSGTEGAPVGPPARN